MDSDLIAGLQISLAGMSLTFLALGLLILVMVLLVRLWPERSAGTPEQAEAGQPPSESADEARREELAAALAVSICLLESQDASDNRDPSLGRLLEQ